MDIFSNMTPTPTGIDLTLLRLRMKLTPDQVTLLQQPSPLFFSCEDIVMTDSTTTLTYTIDKTHRPLSHINRYTKPEKYQILIQIGKILTDTKRTHSVSFDPRNIYFTATTFDISFLLRLLPDTFQEGPARTLEEELYEYKALLLSLLQKKYTFSHFMSYGLKIAKKGSSLSHKQTLLHDIITAKTHEEIEEILLFEYTHIYDTIRKNRIGFNAKGFRRFSIIIAVVALLFASALTWFIYDHITTTRTFGIKMYIYQNYYDRNPLAVVDYANLLSDQDMDDNLKKVVADALIATNDPENFKRAFILDAARQIEIIEKLNLLDQQDAIAELPTTNPQTQLYQAYYTANYAQTVTLAETYTHLRSDPQAQLLLAKAYAAVDDYIKAEAIVEALGNPESLLETYTRYRNEITQKDIAPENSHILKSLDETIKLLEDLKQAREERKAQEEAAREEAEKQDAEKAKDAAKQEEH